MSGLDWYDWHSPYDDEQSPLSERLAIVQRLIADALDTMPVGPIRAVSMCAGQGRDLIDVAARHPRGRDVRARLVELDRRNADQARDNAAASGLDGIEVQVGDAADLSHYADAVPADLVLVCGVFGNISDDDIRRTIEALPQLCASDAVVVWTRHRVDPDLTPAIRGWFAASGFDEVEFVGPADRYYGVGSHHFRGATEALRPDQVVFEFVRV
jgi:hypothetical protein